MPRLYVGNLPFESTEDDIRSFFQEVAAPSRVTIVTDRLTNRSRGFGFVDIDDDTEARKAIEALNGRQMGGRALKVNEAKPLEPRGDRR